MFPGSNNPTYASLFDCDEDHFARGLISSYKGVASDSSKESDRLSSLEVANLAQARIFEIVESPEPFDVLLGRGRRHVSHPGNRRLQIVVNMNTARYNASLCRQDKTRITQDIVHFVKHCGTQPGRFLKHEASAGGWVEVDDEVARIKVAQALRYSRRSPQDDVITKSMILEDEKNRVFPGGADDDENSTESFDSDADPLVSDAEILSAIGYKAPLSIDQECDNDESSDEY